MKKDTKQILVIFALILTLAIVCFTVVGCGDDPAETSGNIFTLPTASDPVQSETSQSSTETSATSHTDPIIPSGNYVNPLTGVPTAVNLSYTRPVAIVVDNYDAALTHQSGLGQADILYEGMVAPGITRFLAVIADYTNIAPICNVRSGRDYHIYSSFNHNAILVSHGGSVTRTPDGSLFVTLAEKLYGNYIAKNGLVYYGFLNTAQETRFYQLDNGITYGTIRFYSDADYSKLYGPANLAKVQASIRSGYTGRSDLKYDTVITASALRATLSGGYLTNVPGFSLGGNPSGSLKFVPYGSKAPMTDAATANDVFVQFSVPGYAPKTVEYLYSSVDGKYTRYQNGTAHVDAETGERLSFTNLITLSVPCNYYHGTTEDPDLVDVRVIGYGEGYYFTGGKAARITWSKISETAPLVLRDASGNELKLTPGKTCISYVNSSDASAVSFTTVTLY
ncbi:MAG: DUF3048 domain-containing protein [Ruminococcus sp.]|nr:DUF3048 domain-containing protein [Candidatus Apopatosoma intestinale]